MPTRKGKRHVVAVVLRRVDAALGRDGVGAAGGVLVEEAQIGRAHV